LNSAQLDYLRNYLYFADIDLYLTDLKILTISKNLA